MNYLSAEIYKRDSTGKLRTWQYQVEGDKYRTFAGLQEGQKITSNWTTCTPKSQATAEAQADFEARAEMNKKLDREYRLIIQELDQVPPSPMLAQDYKKQKKVMFPVYSQPKLDGIRALVSRHGAFSREYQRHLNVDHILGILAPVFAEFPDIHLDGELYNHEFKANFNKISSIVRKQKPDEAEREEARAHIQYHIYDFTHPAPCPAFGKRWDWLVKTLAGRPEQIRLVPTAFAKDQSELDMFYGQYLQDGYEGQIVRLDGLYEVDKRSKNLLKRKEFITAEFQLLRIEEGQGNWAGFAKRIVFQLPDGRECGAGLKGDQTFARDLLGKAGTTEQPKLVTVRHFSPTPDGMPRFPVAVDFHSDMRVD